MKMSNFCKWMQKRRYHAIYKWAESLEADECKINRDGTVTLTCEDGIICEDYVVPEKSLYKYL